MYICFEVAPLSLIVIDSAVTLFLPAVDVPKWCIYLPPTCPQIWYFLCPDELLPPADAPLEQVGVDAQDPLHLVS